VGNVTYRRFVRRIQMTKGFEMPLAKHVGQ
jgi:hypothetical protein